MYVLCTLSVSIYIYIYSSVCIYIYVYICVCLYIYIHMYMYEIVCVYTYLRSLKKHKKDDLEMHFCQVIIRNVMNYIFIIDNGDSQHLLGAIYLFQKTFKGASSSNNVSI